MMVTGLQGIWQQCVYPAFLDITSKLKYSNIRVFCCKRSKIHKTIKHTTYF